MANYNNYFPQSYQSGYNLYGATPTSTQPYVAPAPTTNQPTGITWVQGEAAARAYPIAAGGKAILMDSENNVFYVKSSDVSGMPLPLRIFKYEEMTEGAAPTTDTSNFITKEEFEKRISELESLLRKEKKNEQFAI